MSPFRLWLTGGKKRGHLQVSPQEGNRITMVFVINKYSGAFSFDDFENARVSISQAFLLSFLL